MHTIEPAHSRTNEIHDDSQRNEHHNYSHEHHDETTTPNRARDHKPNKPGKRETHTRSVNRRNQPVTQTTTT